MDRKRYRCSPSSGIIPRAALRAAFLLCFIIAAFVSGQQAGRGVHSAAVNDREIRTKSGTLDSIRNEIESRRKKIRELEKAEGSTLSRLEYLEANIKESRRYLSLLSIQIDTAVKTIARMDDSLQQAGIRLADRKRFMNIRLRQAYIAESETPLMILLLSRTPAEAINRKRYLEAIHRYDLKLVKQINQEQLEFNDQKQHCEDERTRLAVLSAEKTRETGMMVNEDASRRAIVQNIRTTKKAYQKKIAELELAQRKLTEVIRTLAQKMKARKGQKIPTPPLNGTDFGKMKGGFSWPVEGEVVGRFGRIVHPVYGTVIFNNGIDISTQPGKPVKSIASGTVIYTGSMRGMGRLVIVDHGNSYITVYANLDRIMVDKGQLVGPGTVIGRAGIAEDGNGSQVHFEIRKSTDSLDPLSWLKRG